MTDPIKKLPFDLIVLIFSLLSTPQLSLLTGVCRDWRTALQLNAILNRVIDLIDVKRPLSEEEMMEVLRLLCPLSTHPRNEWLLDITNFWYNFSILASKHDIGSEEVMFSRPNEFHSLLSAIALETKGKERKLQKLFLHVDHSHFPRRSMINKDAFARAIAQGWPELVVMMEEVRELHFQVPFSSISVQSGAPGEGGRACSLKSDPYSFDLELVPGRQEGSWKVDEFKVFLEEVIAFTGANITHLGICTGSFESVEKLYKMINLHKDSLNHLELKVECSDQPELALQMVVQCQNLSSLRLYFCSQKENRDFSDLVLAFPTDAPISKLREFEFDSFAGPRIDFSSYPLLNWLGKKLEVFKLSSSFSRISLESLELFFRSNPLLKVIRLDDLRILKPSDSFVPSSPRFSNLRHLELHSVFGYGHLIMMFSAAFLPVLESVILVRCHEEETDRGLYEQSFSILDNCHFTLKSLVMIGCGDRLSTNSGTSDSNQTSLEFPSLEELSLSNTSDRMASLCRRFQFSSSRLRSLEIDSWDWGKADESAESDSILQAIRFLDSSSMTIEVISLSLSHRHLNFDQELNIQTGKVRAFPRMKSLKLNWEFKQIVDYLSSSSFGNLEVLSLYHRQSKTSQTHQEECLKRALSIVELNNASLREIAFSGFKKATGYKPEATRFKLPKLKALCMEVTSPDLVQFFLDQSQGLCLSELTLHALPKSYSLDDLLRVILPMSKRLTRLSLPDVNFGQDEIGSSKEKLQVSSFPILTSLSISGERSLLELFGQYQYPLLYRCSATLTKEESNDKFGEGIRTLFYKNAPILSCQKGGLTIHPGWPREGESRQH